jgi:Uma2 family endonuclease
MPAVPTHHWTVEELERLIEEREGYTPRYELVDGELLVSPSPSRRHQRIVLQLALRLVAYVNRFRVGELVIGPVAVRLEPDSYFEPDLCVVPSIHGGKRPRADIPITKLSLAIEVLSAGSIRHDRITKRKYFQRNRVPEYWIVDGDAEAFEVWHPNDERPAIQDEHLAWQPGAPEPFLLDVREFFVEVADEP